MKLYQPVLFVGLGGTGCDIGAELERRLREEICGPDGNDFRRTRDKGGMLPYQLPSCLQFVYADMNQAELDRLPRRVVPGPEHIPASALTAHYVTGLVPDIVSYPELAARLRLRAEEVIDGWLPPATRDEPKVNPLHRGAGQFPTIGRASLFGTFLEGIAPVERDIRQAVGKLVTAGEDLQAMGGKPAQGVDVFVAFSVAGGTGAGIFYDYLHIIADTVARHSSMRVKLYPLVLMPSAFAEGLGGGRPAQLNAGRALLDLFRLVDNQNGADAELMLRGTTDRKADTADEVAVSYPDHSRLVMPPGTMQTGFLFSQPAGASREDMHRSIASLVLSLVGTELSADDDRNGEHHQSFADSFVNEAAHRQVAAENGIGGRGVSTALVASLTIPVDELAGIVGSRMLREAIAQISGADGRLESNRNAIEEFFTRSGVHPVLSRQGVEYSDPAPVNGAKEITTALNRRRDSMRIGIDALRTKLGQEVPQFVSRFDPASAARDMLGQMDVFRLQRVVSGHHALRDEVERGGVHGLLQGRRAAPQPPEAGWSANPPGSPQLKDRSFGRKLLWGDEVPTGARNAQNAWYAWQTKVVWSQAWDTHTPQWTRALEQVQRDIGALTRALSDFVRADLEDFPRRSAELYRKRVGVSYLLPSGHGGIDHFYDQVYRRLREYLVNQRLIDINSPVALVLRALIGAETWSDAFRISIEQSPENAVSYLRERAKTEIKKFLRIAPPGEQPILPRLHDLLIEAAGHGRGTGMTIDPEYVEGFRGKLAGLLPANFAPQGNGQMKVLITYPANADSEPVKNYLRSSVALPRGPRVTNDFRHTDTESISVVLFRTAMGVTEVDEVRDVLRMWARALDEPRPTDLLRWRQRTGYDFGYLATREHHRVEILHRILCALWNGKATIVGPESSPERINVRLGGGVTMTLPLTPLGKASSWGSLLRAYEQWALDDDDMHRAFSGKLMEEVPVGLRGRPEPPHEPYNVVRSLAEEQSKLLDDMLKRQASNQQSRAVQMRAFWAETLPAALDQEFTQVDSPTAASLRELEQTLEPGDLDER
jgi:Tubulin like